MKIRKLLSRIKHSIYTFYILYADSTDLLEKAGKVIRPLPEGCELVKLTYENKNCYKCKWNVDQMLSVGDEAWAVVNNDNEIIGYHYGAYQGKTSLFYKVKNCDYEHIEIMVDERFRRNGLAVYLLYHAVKNLNFEDVNHKKIGTCIRPYNNPSLILHELIGFKIYRRVRFIHKKKTKDGRFVYVNFPLYSI